ncbi:52_t:CDS:2, partial [Scutellospora calospora]
EEYLKTKFAELGSKNNLTVECSHSDKSWVANSNHWNYGGSIPVTSRCFEKKGVLFPMGRGDD